MICGGGEPKSKPPVEALIAAASMLQSGEIRYTPADGVPALKKAIIRYTEQFYDRLVEPENVMASGGAKQSLMCVLQAILNPMDEVIYPAPYWVSYPEMVKLIGALPVPVLPEDGTFHPRLKDIEAKTTSNTKAIIVNSPNNPSGIMYDESFYAEIVEYCEKRGIYLIMDDIYHRLVFGNKKPINVWKFVKDRTENGKLVIINGVSKQYAMTGFRIGWAVASKNLIRAAADIQSHQTSGPSALLQHAAGAALNGIQTAVESLRITLENNSRVMVAELKAFTGVHLIPPDGAFYCFPDFSYYSKDSVALSKMLLDKVRVVTVPGAEFGMEGHLRLSTCGTVKDITEGIERMKWALDPNSPNELYIGQRKLVRDWA